MFNNKISESILPNPPGSLALIEHAPLLVRAVVLSIIYQGTTFQSR